MKTKNQTEQNLLELGLTAAANDDGISAPARPIAALPAKSTWSPYEVWRTRVKVSASTSRKGTAQG